MTNKRCLLVGTALLAALAPLVLTSCQGRVGAAQAAAPKAKTPARADPAANLGVTGSGLFFVLQDPKAPGRPLVKLWAGGLSGAFTGQGVTGGMTSVSAMLYQRGVAAAKLTAPTVKGDNLSNALVASGRVTVTSLQQPGTLMRAERMTWYPKKNQVFADGNVYYHDGKYGATMNAPHLIADTFLGKIVVPSAPRRNPR